MGEICVRSTPPTRAHKAGIIFRTRAILLHYLTAIRVDRSDCDKMTEHVRVESVINAMGWGARTLRAILLIEDAFAHIVQKTRRGAIRQRLPCPKVLHNNSKGHA